MDGGVAVKSALMGMVAMLAVSAVAFELTWTTADGGGVMWSVGGGFTLGASVGQPDAGGATGPGFVLEGGFWPGAFDLPGLLWPRLRMAFIAGGPHVYWPAGATNWALQVSHDIRGPAWSAVTNQPQQVGSEWRVPTGPASSAVYRLEVLP